MSTDTQSPSDSDDTATDDTTPAVADDAVELLDVRALLKQAYYHEHSLSPVVEGHRDGSHRELDPQTFHPSQVGYDEWLLYVKKLGLDASSAWNYFLGGDLIHSYLEQALTTLDEIPLQVADADGPRHTFDDEHVAARFSSERAVNHERDGLEFVGHADCHDTTAGVVYDFKTRGSWYNFDPPVDRHLDQLHVYMDALDAEYGQIVYISKKDFEVRTWPEASPFVFNEARMDEIVARAQRVRDAIIDDGFPRAADEIPFERPDSYFANNVELDFSAFSDDGES